MTCHHPELGSASNWSYHVGNLLQPIRSTTQICVVTRHQYGISALVSQTSFRGGNQWWRRKVSAVFSRYTGAGRSRPLSALTSLHENSAFVFLQRPAVLQILDEWKFLYCLPGFSGDAKIDLYSSLSHGMISKPIRLTASGFSLSLTLASCHSHEESKTFNVNTFRESKTTTAIFKSKARV